MWLVFDVGATHTRLGLAEAGKLIKTAHFDTDPSVAGFDAWLGCIREFTAGKTIVAAAGGLPGQFEGDKGVFVFTTYLTNWLDIPVGERLSEILGCPVRLRNDVALGGLGEAHYGAGSPTGVMAYLTVSTGVNAIRIVDGKLDPTISRYELGKQMILTHGRRKSLEDLTGGAALELARGLAPDELDDPRFWQKEDEYLALGLYNMMLYWDPKVIVLGGKMMVDIDISLVETKLHSLPQVLPGWPLLVPAQLGDHMGLYGALAWLEQG